MAAVNPRSATVVTLAAACVAVAGCGGDTPAPACGGCGTPRVAATSDAVWVAFESTLVRLDPATGRILTTARTTRGSALSTVAATSSATWTATSGRLYVLPRGGNRLRRVPLADVLPGIAPQSNTRLTTVVDVAVMIRGRNVLRLSPGAAPVVAYRTASPYAWAIADGRLLWVGERNGTVRRIDPATGRAVGSDLQAGVPVAGIAPTSAGHG